MKAEVQGSRFKVQGSSDFERIGNYPGQDPAVAPRLHWTCYAVEARRAIERAVVALRIQRENAADERVERAARQSKEAWIDLAQAWGRACNTARREA